MLIAQLVLPAAIAFVIPFASSVAGEARVRGGLSPDEKLEVVAVEKTPSADLPTNHEFVLRKTASRKVQTKISEAGYAKTIQAAIDAEFAVNTSVLWSPDSTTFAFNLRDTKRSRSTLVFALRDGRWEPIPLKDPFPQLFGELGIKGVNRCAFTDPLRWEGKNTLVMKSSGDCVLPNLGGRWFEYEVKYELSTPKKFSIKRTTLSEHNG